MSHALFFVSTFAMSWANSLIRASWQGGLGIALIWLLCRLWPGMPPIPRCRLWRLAYAKLLLGLVCLPPLALPLLPRTSAPIQTVPTAASQENTAQIALTEAPLQSAATAPAPTFATLTTTAPMPPPPSRPSLPTVQTCLVVAWLLGILVSLVPIAAAWRRAQSLYNTSAPLTDEALEAEAADLCRRFGLRRVPPVRVTNSRTSPVLLGRARPSILLPAFVLTDSPRPELRLMLAHEMAHLARRDLLWNVLPLLAQRLFFFHPLVWLAGHEWALAQEIACDALAVEATGTPPSAYGRMLLGIATRRASAASLFPTLAVAAPRHTLRRRLFAMQHLGTTSRPRVILAAALTAAFALGGLLPWRVVAQSGPPPSLSPAATQGDEDWQKQQQKELADIASKNAQLDAQLAKVQKHLPVAQPKKAEALAYIRWIKADYATNQMNVQLLEQQRANYVAVHPNSLTNTQIAFVQQVNQSEHNHRRISRNTRAKLANIPEDQRDRVAILRHYDLEIEFARMRAYYQKQLNVFQLRVEYSASKRPADKLPVKWQSRQTIAKASLVPLDTSAASSSLLTTNGLSPSRVVRYIPGATEATQPRNPAHAQVQTSPVMAEALDKEIAQLERQQRVTDRAAHPNWVADAGAVIAFLKARRGGAAWAQASIASPEFSPGVKGQKLANLRRFEQQAQQDKYIAEKYVFLLAVHLSTQANRRRIAPLQDQRLRQMKKDMPPHSPAVPPSLRHTLYCFPKQGHRIRIFTQDGTGRHLVLDRISDGKPVISPTVTVKEGSKVDFLVYDNSKLVKNQSL